MCFEPHLPQNGHHSLMKSYINNEKAVMNSFWSWALRALRKKICIWISTASVKMYVFFLICDNENACIQLHFFFVICSIKVHLILQYCHLTQRRLKEEMFCCTVKLKVVLPRQWFGTAAEISWEMEVIYNCKNQVIFITSYINGHRLYSRACNTCLRTTYFHNFCPISDNFLDRFFAIF